ncbi:MAG: primosomal protein N', partial [Leptolyngbyaceae cyanobacterium SM2_3_12]|nr:primosomal protein N' [Leptolyngbyaceae cyanobacterium SM2_3_12]
MERTAAIDNRPRWVNVLVDYGGQPAAYTYLVPTHLEVQAGDILMVPFRQQRVGAIALTLLADLPASLTPEQIRPIEGVVERRFFSATYWQLLERIAHHYQVPLIQVLKTALPPGLLGKSQRRLRLCPERIPPLLDEALLTPGVVHLLAELRKSPTGDYTWNHLQRRGGGSYRALQQL